VFKLQNQVVARLANGLGYLLGTAKAGRKKGQEIRTQSI
jgi:hypothetical protein